jgi:hypothetical protein
VSTVPELDVCSSRFVDEGHRRHVSELSALADLVYLAHSFAYFAFFFFSFRSCRPFTRRPRLIPGFPRVRRRARSCRWRRRSSARNVRRRCGRRRASAHRLCRCRLLLKPEIDSLLCHCTYRWRSYSQNFRLFLVLFCFCCCCCCFCAEIQDASHLRRVSRQEAFDHHGNQPQFVISNDCQYTVALHPLVNEQLPCSHLAICKHCGANRKYTTCPICGDAGRDSSCRQLMVMSRSYRNCFFACVVVNKIQHIFIR